MHDESNMESTDWLTRGISPKKLAKERERTLKKATKELERIEKRKKKRYEMSFSKKSFWISTIILDTVCFVMYAISAFIAPTIPQIILKVVCSVCWGAVAGLNIASYIRHKKQHNNSEKENEK